MVVQRGTRERRGASACVRVRFQRHDVLPYAFCFNFLEATGSISFPSFHARSFSLSPSLPPLLPPSFTLSLSLSLSSFSVFLYPPSQLPLLVPRGSPAKCTTVVFSTVDAARYISSSSLLPIPPCPPRPFSILPRRLHRPHRALSLVLLSLLPIYPLLATHSLMPPPLRHRVKG